MNLIQKRFSLALESFCIYTGLSLGSTETYIDSLCKYFTLPIRESVSQRKTQLAFKRHVLISKLQLREMRLAKERWYSHKNEQNHHAILERSLAYTAYPDGVYDVLSHRPLSAPTTETSTVDGAPDARTIQCNAEEVASPIKEPVETALQRFKIDYRANELQRRKATVKFSFSCSLGT